MTPRNPADRPAEFLLDFGPTFELPPNAPRSYVLQTRWGGNSSLVKVKLEAGRPQPVKPAPFEVIVLEAPPQT